MSCERSTFFALPNLEGVQSIVLSIDGELSAHPLSDDFRVDVEANEILLLGYQGSLESLQLDEGPITEDGRSRPCPIIRPDVAWKADVSGDVDLAVWVEHRVPQSLLDRLSASWRTDCLFCLSFDTARISMTPLRGTSTAADDSRVVGAAWLEDGSALVAREQKGLYRLDRSGELTRLSGCDETDYRAFLPVSDDRFWAGSRARLDRLLIDKADGSCTVETSASVAVEPGQLHKYIVTHIDGSAAPSAPEIYLKMTGGSLWRFTSDELEEIAALDVAPSDTTGTSALGGVAYLGPNRAVFSAGSDEIGYWTAGEPLRVEQIPVAVIVNSPRVSSIALHSELGLLIGTSNGEVRRQVGSEWEDLGADLEGRVGGITQLLDGFVGMTAGRLAHFVPGTGFCPLTEFSGSNNPGAGTIARVSEEDGTRYASVFGSLLAVPDTERNQDAAVFWFRAERP